MQPLAPRLQGRLRKPLVKKWERDNDRPYFYGLGVGEEKPHADLPGLVSVTANEFYARNFFLRWRDALMAVEEE